MCLAKGKVPCDSLKVQNGCDSCTLKVIGYKKAERPYYLLRFITHKNGTFPSTPKEIRPGEIYFKRQGGIRIDSYYA